MSRGVDGATELVPPDPDGYPEFFSDSFADTVGVDLVDLAPPTPTLGLVEPATVQVTAATWIRTDSMPPSPTATWPCSLLSALLPTLDGVPAYPLGDFIASPFGTFKTVPEDFIGPYATSISRIMKHLVDALESGGVDRDRHLAIATSWYAAAPALLSQPANLCRAQRGSPPRSFQTVPEKRLCSFPRRVAMRLRQVPRS